jgi:hypothetical protein
MKKKGKKMLETDVQNFVENKPQEECPQCAFCQEELLKENFAAHPFGNFSYCSNSKLLYLSVCQTISGSI